MWCQFWCNDIPLFTSKSSLNRCQINTFINTPRPRQNGCHLADGIFKRIFLNKNVWISIKISLKFVPKGPINNIPALVQVMAWCRPGDKPLSESMMVSLLTHICVTRPQWVNTFGWHFINPLWVIDSCRMHMIWYFHCDSADQCKHYDDVIMGAIASLITSLTIIYSTVYSDADQRKHQSSASLAFVWGIHRGPVNSPHKWPVTRKMFPVDDVIMVTATLVDFMNTLGDATLISNQHC